MSTPTPLTPPDCDLQGLPFMPLHVARLRDSDLAAEESAEACWYAVVLWCASWHQLPAASLPDNDAVLAKLAGLGRDQRTWSKVKAGALRGFVKCTDGRLYHPVVAEQALEAWGRREEFEERQANKETRQQRWRRRCKELSETLRESGVTPPAGASLRVLEEMVACLPSVDSRDGSPSTETSPVDAREMPLTGTGTGTGTQSSVPDGTDAAASSDGIADLRALPVAKGCWRLAVLVLTAQGGLTEVKARTFTGKLKALGLSDDELWSICEAAWKAETRDPVSYLTKAGEGVIERRGSQQIDAPSERQQRSWMEDWRDRGAPSWRRHERGPYPGEDGCRVADGILREFGFEPHNADLIDLSERRAAG